MRFSSASSDRLQIIDAILPILGACNAVLLSEQYCPGCSPPRSPPPPSPRRASPTRPNRFFTDNPDQLDGIATNPEILQYLWSTYGSSLKRYCMTASLAVSGSPEPRGHLLSKALDVDTARRFDIIMIMKLVSVWACSTSATRASSPASSAST